MLLVLPPQSYLGWKVSIILLHAIAVVTTILRLVHRFRLRRTWWDDYILFVPLVFNLAYWVLFCWGFSEPTGLHGTKDDMTSEDSIFDSYWLATLPGILVWWRTRAVIALSLARMLPFKHPARQWSFVLIAFMTVLNIAAIGVTIATCHVSSALLNQGEFQECVKGPGGFSVRNIFLFAESLGTDTLLVVFASGLIWQLKLSVTEHRLAATVLFASLITLLYTTAFLVIADTDVVYMGRNTVLVETGLHNIQTALSLFLCNLPVVVTCFSGWTRHSLHTESLPAPESAGISMAQSYSSSSCCSDPLTQITLTGISDISRSSIQQSAWSLGSIYSSWHASQENSSRCDVEIAAKQPDLTSKAL